MHDLPAPPLTDHFQAALAASCDALIELELLRAEAVGAAAAQGHTACAIHALRWAIAEFRTAHRLPSGALEAGFVAAPSGRAARRRSHSKPRRTA